MYFLLSIKIMSNPPEPCPIMCASEIISPVCGSDGKTYSNSCQLRAVRLPGRATPGPWCHPWPGLLLLPLHHPGPRGTLSDRSSLPELLHPQRGVVPGSVGWCARRRRSAPPPGPSVSWHPAAPHTPVWIATLISSHAHAHAHAQSS